MKLSIASLLILFAPVLKAEILEKEIESTVEGIAVIHIYRDGIKILEVSSPNEDAPTVYANTTYTIITDGLPLYQYQNSKSGGSFQRLNFVNMKYAVKLHSYSGGTIETIVVYTADFEKTVEAFHLKEGRLIAFSDKEMSDRRRTRKEG